MNCIRLDRLLSNSGYGTRSECTGLIRKKRVTVDSSVVTAPETKIDVSRSSVAIDGIPVEIPRTVVCVMNKPAGFVCSTCDPRDRTVMELLPENLLRQNVLPAGRLDKDTEGLLIFSNDGNLIHRLISPKSEIAKTYLVNHTGSVTDAGIMAAQAGLILKNGTKCKPAVITLLGDGESLIRITEGMYHQVKCMYASLGMHVLHLKRIQIGSLVLDNLSEGETRELSEAEIRLLLGK